MAVALDPEALTTVDAVRDGFTTSASDDALTRKINTISERFASRTGRRFAWKLQSAGDAEYLRGSRTHFLHLQRMPITDVIRVSYGCFGVDATGNSTFLGTPITDFQRTAQFDAAGKIHRLSRWWLTTGAADILTAQPDLRRSSQQYTYEVQYAGGWILPQYDGEAHPTHNPTGAPANFQHEDLVIQAVRSAMSRPVGDLIEVQTAGGWRRKWSDRAATRGTEFDLEVEEWLNSITMPSAICR